MASLPSQHPSLAIHMTDRATTPLISSAPSSNSSASHSPSSSKPQARARARQQRPLHPKQTKRQAATFSTSPPSSASSPTSSTPSSAGDDEDGDEDDDDDDDDDVEDEPPSPASRQAEALTNLSATALLSYDAAKRLGRGAPLRTMVEYPEGGPVVLHSYMCPMGLALGAPGRSTSSASLHTAAGAVGSAPGSVNGGDDHHGGGGGDGGDDDDGAGGGGPDAAATRGEGPRDGDHRSRSSRRTPTRPLSFVLDPAGDDGGGGGGGGGDMEGIDPSDPPMLASTVVAARAEDLREARRATARLEKVARVFQAEWVATGRR
ncbi:hypothetical protein UCDDA912_g07083 [Diaporthe ampelina]|uniref:Uncharacterized protein n=1 Tax=Diaporthe ampelina TaxID=1214573 RepID=A0A0G2HCS4_9PEZI|nr:hypothetical protein UCDDA912_g07083 [Diaporthe ampelina]